MLHSSTQWGTAKVLLLFSAILFIELKELLVLETPIAFSDLAEINWCYSSMLFINEGQTEGWMNTDASSCKPPFHKRPGSKAAFGTGTRIQRGSLLLVQYPDHSTTLLFLLSEYWTPPCRTAQPVQEGMRMPPSSPSAVCQCHWWTWLGLMWVWVSSDTGEQGGPISYLWRTVSIKSFWKQAALPLHLYGIWPARRHSWFQSL